MSRKNYNRDNAILCRILINSIRAEKGMELLPVNDRLTCIGWYENGRLVTRLKNPPKRYRFYDRETGELLAEGVVREIAKKIGFCYEYTHQLARVGLEDPERAKYRVEEITNEE